MLLIGPPGTGKTMLARRLPSILPPLTHDEAIAVTRIYSAAGRLPPGAPLVAARPFRAPHHTTSVQALVGGGSPPAAGEVSLAHLGVLFLDEAAEFHHDALDALRQPLEEGRVVIVRVAGAVVFPARCMLVVAMNPCPCGFLGDARRPCRCLPQQRARYRARVSGPLLDRIDLHVDLPALAGEELAAGRPGERSADVRARVVRARALQGARGTLLGLVGATNASMPPGLARACCTLGAEARAILRGAVDRLGLSPRAYHRIVRVARTIADLDGGEAVAPGHIAEAVGYRSLDRPLDPAELETGARGPSDAIRCP